MAQALWQNCSGCVAALAKPIASGKAIASGKPIASGMLSGIENAPRLGRESFHFGCILNRIIRLILPDFRKA